MKMKKLLLLIALIGSIFTAKPIDFKESSAVDNAKWGALRLGIGYGLWKSAFFVHELGHSLMAKVLTRSPIDIVLGKNPGEPIDKPLYQNSWLKVYKQFFTKVGSGGYANSNVGSRAQTIGIIAAGPFAGIGYGLGVLSAANGNSKNINPLDTLLLKSVGSLLVVNNIANLIPEKESGLDGELIMRELTKSGRFCVNKVSSSVMQCALGVGIPLLFLKTGFRFLNDSESKLSNRSK